MPENPEMTERNLAAQRRGARRCLRGLGGWQSVHTETAERSVASVLETLRHGGHSEAFVRKQTRLVGAGLALRVPHKIFDSNSGQRFLTE